MVVFTNQTINCVDSDVSAENYDVILRWRNTPRDDVLITCTHPQCIAALSYPETPSRSLCFIESERKRTSWFVGNILHFLHVESRFGLCSPHVWVFSMMKMSLNTHCDSTADQTPCIMGLSFVCLFVSRASRNTQ